MAISDTTAIQNMLLMILVILFFLKGQDGENMGLRMKELYSLTKLLLYPNAGEAQY